MVRTLLIRGMLVGLVAGLVAFGVARLLGEPAVRTAVAFESYVETVHHEAPEAELVSRSIQDSAGLGAGAVLYGVVFGGVYALVFALAYGRLGTYTARGTAAVLGLLGFVSVYLVPILKYPANPPSIGNPDTIVLRTGLFVLMIAISVVAMVLAVMLRRRLVVRLGEWNATLVAGACYVVVIAVSFIVLPGVNEVPQQAIKGVVDAVTDANSTFPPAVLWRFRLASIGIQAAMWTTIALGFGWLAGRQLERSVKAPAAVGSTG
jgi:hypothetical protein